MSTLKQRKEIQIIILVIIGCTIMAIVESILKPGYFYKSIIKMITFFSCFLIFKAINRTPLLIFKIDDKKQLLISLLIGLVVYGIIISGYYIFKDLINFNNITNNLLEKENITKNNFIYVSVYISIINSFIEELFFRGFAFIELKKHLKTTFAYLISAILFAIYHIFIIFSWFSLPLFILLLISLIIAGIIFNYFDRKGSIYHSWIIHICANLSINTIGFIMFYFV